MPFKFKETQPLPDFTQLFNPATGGSWTGAGPAPFPGYVPYGALNDPTDYAHVDQASRPPTPAAAPAPPRAGNTPVSRTQGPGGGGGGSPAAGPMGATSSDMGGNGGGGGDYLQQLLAALGPAPAAPQYDPAQLARDTINTQYGSQESALQRAMDAAQALYNQQSQTQTLYGQGADKRLADLYAALKNDLGRGQVATRQNYGQTMSDVGQTYDQAGHSLEQLNSGIVNRLMGSAQQLGIQQGAGSPLERLMQSYQTMAGSNIQNKATSLSGLNTDAANSLALGQMGINSSEKQGATERADMARSVQQALANLGLSNAQSQTEFQGQMADLEGKKASDYRTTLAGLAQSQYEQQRQSRLDQLAELVQLGTLDTQRQYMGIRQQTADQNFQLGLGNLQINQGQLELQRQKLQQDYALATDPAKQAQIMAQIQQIGSQIDLNNSRTNYYNQGGAQGSKQVHNDSLLQFFASPQQGLWGNEGAGPKFQSALTDPQNGLITKAQQDAKLLGGDPFTLATARAAEVAKANGLNLNGLLNAIAIYFRGQT